MKPTVTHFLFYENLKQILNIVDDSTSSNACVAALTDTLPSQLVVQTLNLRNFSEKVWAKLATYQFLAFRGIASSTGEIIHFMDYGAPLSERPASIACF